VPHFPGNSQAKSGASVIAAFGLVARIIPDKNTCSPRQVMSGITYRAVFQQAFGSPAHSLCSCQCRLAFSLPIAAYTGLRGGSRTTKITSQSAYNSSMRPSPQPETLKQRHVSLSIRANARIMNVFCVVCSAAVRYRTESARTDYEPFSRRESIRATPSESLRTIELR
jgi:hypothetical protein